jgi:hypothetical protein
MNGRLANEGDCCSADGKCQGRQSENGFQEIAQFGNHLQQQIHERQHTEHPDP